MKRTLIVVLLLCIPASSFAADPFKDIVRAIEREYGVRHHGIPWFARVVMKPAMWGSGTSGLKLAEFENGSFRGEDKQSRVAEVIERTVGPEWQQIVRIRSRVDNETTYIYVRPEGQRITMLIASVESNEAEVVQITLKPDQFEKWADDTGAMAKTKIKHREPGRTKDITESALLVSSDTPGGYEIIVP